MGFFLCLFFCLWCPYEEEGVCRMELGADKSAALAVELKLVCWSCRSVHGWTGAAMKQRSERCEKFLTNLDLCARCFGAGRLDTVR